MHALLIHKVQCLRLRDLPLRFQVWFISCQEHQSILITLCSYLIKPILRILKRNQWVNRVAQNARMGVSVEYFCDGFEILFACGIPDQNFENFTVDTNSECIELYANCSGTDEELIFS